MVGLDGAVFHLHGKTSIGKSATLRVADSIWRNHSLPTWKTTSNGLEGRLAQANGTFLAMDELPKIPHSGFENDIYMLGNGVGKQRATKAAKAGELAEWTMFTMSSGEHDLVTVLASLGKERHGGQAVRFVDVIVDEGRYGSFSDIHAFKTGGAFVDHIRAVAMTEAGHAGPAFVQRLLDEGIDRKALTGRLEDYAAQLRNRLQASAETPLQGEVTRVVTQFAVIAMAGELATSWGVTGWPKGTAQAAVDDLVTQWFESRGGNIKVDLNDALKRTQAFLARLCTLCGEA
jgi:putative DNA primase/helicase